MAYHYGEDKLIEHELGWDAVLAYDAEDYGVDNMFGRVNCADQILPAL